ncbi:hypothetical protein GOODEAATRI_030297 [Goodea atripinnis]|uniref:Uncharacterized protein n=1 Tax=Goodea atripinnis TaxID=208336 RepID=A0ABV0PIE6_9TELE
MDTGHQVRASNRTYHYPRGFCRETRYVLLTHAKETLSAVQASQSDHRVQGCKILTEEEMRRLVKHIFKQHCDMLKRLPEQLPCRSPGFLKLWWRVQNIRGVRHLNVSIPLYLALSWGGHGPDSRAWTPIDDPFAHRRIDNVQLHLNLMSLLQPVRVRPLLPRILGGVAGLACDSGNPRESLYVHSERNDTVRVHRGHVAFDLQDVRHGFALYH